MKKEIDGLPLKDLAQVAVQKAKAEGGSINLTVEITNDKEIDEEWKMLVVRLHREKP